MLVSRDDSAATVKVLDFGLSKMMWAENGTHRSTQQGIVMGTPDYMSPEQARGDQVDHRVDIYSFGILAYELVTNTVPFVAENMTAILMKHLTELPEPPSIRKPGIGLPPPFEAMILRALEKDPARRQQSRHG